MALTSDLGEVATIGIGGVVASLVMMVGLGVREPAPAETTAYEQWTAELLAPQECRRQLQARQAEAQAGGPILWVWAEETVLAPSTGLYALTPVTAPTKPRPYALAAGAEAPAWFCSFRFNSVGVLRKAEAAVPGEHDPFFAFR